MPHRGTVIALAMALAGCDDTLYQYPPRIVEYDADWDGIVAFTYDNCRVCHPGVVPQVPLPEAIEEDVRCGDDRCIEPPWRPDGVDEPPHGFPVCETVNWICGAYVVPGEPENSTFWRFISEEAAEPGDQIMPMTGYLPPEQVEFVREWIELGAPL